MMKFHLLNHIKSPKRVLRDLASTALFAIALLAGTADSSFAQTSSPQPATSSGRAPVDLRVDECDPSMNLLNAILSGISGQTYTDNAAGGGENDFRNAASLCRAQDFVWKAQTPTGPIAKMFDHLVALALIFGGAMLIYFTVIGTVKSAEDGEVLGRQWSPFWVTARTSIGFTMLAPTGSGFALVQVGLMILVAWGVGGANWLWRGTVSSYYSNPAEMVALREINQASITNIMRSTLKGETCIRVLNRQSGGASTYARSVTPAKYDPSKGDGSMLIQWGQVIDGENTGSCGSIYIEGRDSYYNPVNLFRTSILQAQMIVQRSTGEGVVAAANSMAPLADKIVNFYMGGSQSAGQEVFGAQASSAGASSGASAPTAAQIDQLRGEIYTATRAAATTMSKTIMSRAREITGSSGENLSSLTEGMMKGTVEDAKKLGWVGAASMYYQITRVNSKINEITSKLPTIKQPEVATETTQYAFPVHISTAIDSAFTSESIGKNEYVSASNKDEIGDSGKDGLLSGLSTSARRAAYEFIGVDNENPRHAIVQLKSVGDTLIGSVELLIVGSKVASMVEYVPGGKTLVSGVSAAGSMTSGPLKGFAKFFDNEAGSLAVALGTALVMALYVGAIMLAYWIPMVPFVIYLGGIFGWVVSVLEMLGASILWMIAHLHPEGEGMAGKWGANGWMIIIEAIARPTLMVVGLVLANAVTDPFLRFANVLFYISMDYTTSESLAVITPFVAFACINVALMVILVHRTYSLIHMIPNAIFKWIGAHANSYDDGHFSEAMKAPVNAALQKVGQAGAAAAPGLMTLQAIGAKEGASVDKAAGGSKRSSSKSGKERDSYNDMSSTPRDNSSN